MLGAINCNKKIICSDHFNNFIKVIMYPNKYIHHDGDNIMNWFNKTKIEYDSIEYRLFEQYRDLYKNLLLDGIVPKKEEKDHLLLGDNKDKKEKQSILLVIDSYGWAFDNIASNIVAHNTRYDIHIATYPELINKINRNYIIDPLRKKAGYTYSDIDINKNYNRLILFWYGGDNYIILNYYRQFRTKIYLCIYDYSLWINNPDKNIEIMFRNKLGYFLDKIDGYLYASPFILLRIEEVFAITDIPRFTCYDGVDSSLFYFQPYRDDILTKEKLIIGWIGNSDPSTHGVNKGFTIIKNLIESMPDEFIFEPQDSLKQKIDHDLIPEYLSKIDIIVCFSIAEGTPNQILEASSSGRCWISTRVGIAVELYNSITDKPTGILIERNTKELRDALMKLYYNRHLIVTYGENGRLAIEKHWDWHLKTQQFYDLFET
jgi:glycosyltransferase involved in cell wall biosynthesis